MAGMCPLSMMWPDAYPHHPSLSRTLGWDSRGQGQVTVCGSGFPVARGSVLPPIQVSAEKKQTGSTVGMQTSVETSTLLKVSLLGTVETRALPKVSVQCSKRVECNTQGWVPLVAGWLLRFWVQTYWQRV